MPRDLPRVFVYGAATTSGVLVALAAHILLSGVGIDLAGLWRDPQAFAPGQVRWALAWWLIAGAAFAAAFLTVGMLRGDAERTKPSAAQWMIGSAIVVLLAVAGRGGAGPASVTAAQKIATSLAAVGLGALTAAVGSYFALRR